MRYEHKGNMIVVFNSVIVIIYSYCLIAFYQGNDIIVKLKYLSTQVTVHQQFSLRCSTAYKSLYFMFIFNINLNFNFIDGHKRNETNYEIDTQDVYIVIAIYQMKSKMERLFPIACVV